MRNIVGRNRPFSKMVVSNSNSFEFNLDESRYQRQIGQHSLSTVLSQPRKRKLKIDKFTDICVTGYIRYALSHANARILRTSDRDSWNKFWNIALNILFLLFMESSS